MLSCNNVVGGAHWRRQVLGGEHSRILSVKTRRAEVPSLLFTAKVAKRMVRVALENKIVDSGSYG